MKTIFVFAYYSFNDPVFQSAVLDYLKKLSGDEFRFIILTWEQKSYHLTRSEKEKIRADLAKQNIIWERTLWHSGKFKLIKKIYDFLFGLCLSVYLIIRFKASKIYSEGFPGAIIGHFLSILTIRPHVVHTFEPHADYMKDSQVWSVSDWEYRLIKSMEMPIARHASHIITATELYKEILVKKDAGNVKVIPSCVDFEQLKFSLTCREKIREKIKIEGNQIAIVSMGKMGGMYMEDELFQFMKHCISLNETLFKFILLTNATTNKIDHYLKKYNIDDQYVFHTLATKREVPYFLSAADVAFSPVRPIPSQRFSSPIKHGEYWASGLPILIAKGVSDDYLLVDRYNLGMSFENISDITENILKEKSNISRNYIRQQTVTLRDISRYINEFKSIFHA